MMSREPSKASPRKFQTETLPTIIVRFSIDCQAGQVCDRDGFPLDQCPITTEGIGNNRDNVQLMSSCKFAAGLLCGASHTIRIFNTQYDRHKGRPEFLSDRREQRPFLLNTAF